MPTPTKETTKMTPVQLRIFSEDFVRKHLKACCQELIIARDTTIIPDGYVRDLAKLWSDHVTGSGLAIAQGYVTAAAYEYIAEEA